MKVSKLSEGFLSFHNCLNHRNKKINCKVVGLIEFPIPLTTSMQRHKWLDNTEKQRPIEITNLLENILLYTINKTMFSYTKNEGIKILQSVFAISKASLLNSRDVPVINILSNSCSQLLFKTQSRSPSCIFTPLYIPLYTGSVRLAPASVAEFI